jgi:hypothetical protein
MLPQQYPKDWIIAKTPLSFQFFASITKFTKGKDSIGPIKAKNAIIPKL